MPYGLKEIELAKLSKVFASNEHIKRVILYGSRAKGNYKLFSDVDITLEGPELTLTDLNHLSLAIDDLLLPYQFDISIFHTLKNHDLIDHIQRIGITIFERESEWKEYKLGEIASFVKEKVAVHSIATEKYISTENMFPDKGGITVASGKPEEGTVTKYYPNTILVSNIRPYFKKIWYANREGGCSNDVLCFEAKEGIVDSKYLFFLLSQDIFFDYVMLGSKGCKMPRGDKAHIMNWDISLPSLDEQRRIAAILSSLDDKIDLLHRENATLEQMAETMFRQWFVVEAKEEWEEVFLEDIAILNAGGDKPKIVAQNRTNEYNVPIYSNGIDNDGLYGYTDRPRITEESVTISARGTIGFVALRTEPFVPIVRLITLRPKEMVTTKFLYYWAKSQNINGTGTTQQQLTVPDFKQTKLSLPPKDLIVKFTYLTNQYFDKILLNNKQIQTLIQTRDGLLPRLMSGEVKS